MSSRRTTIGTLSAIAIAASLFGCAAFRRGEYWHDDTSGGSGGGTSGATASSNEAGDAHGDDSSSTSGGSTDSSGSSGSSDGEPMATSFAGEVLPLLHAGCDRCHTAGGAANDTAFLLDVDEQTSYETTLEFIDLDTPSASRLLAKASGKGHIGGVIYDDHSAEYATMLAWITEGAAP